MVVFTFMGLTPSAREFIVPIKVGENVISGTGLNSSSLLHKEFSDGHSVYSLWKE